MELDPGRLIVYKLLTQCVLVCAAAFAAPKLDLVVIDYADFANQREALKQALHDHGIVGIRGVFGSKQKLLTLIQAARDFSNLPLEVKEQYAPDRASGDIYGFELGKERFKDQMGNWVVDNLKASYYASIPDTADNKWPVEVELKEAFQALGDVMSDVGKQILEVMGLIGPKTGIYVDGVPRCGRMLHYHKATHASDENPDWCGNHFDHGLFTALAPAFYFQDGEPVAEPEEAGLFVKTHVDGIYKKASVSDPNILFFQVGEFGQLISNDRIRATEHVVHKANDAIDRFTMVMFFDVPFDTVIHSQSELTADSRYEGGRGDPCSYKCWSDRSFARYLVQ